MDICGPNWNEGKNSANHFDNHQYFYSGSFLKQSPPPPSQYIPSLFSSRNGYEQSKRITTETPKEPEKHQHMSEDETVCAAEKWKLYTGSFQFQEHGVECVQGRMFTVTFGTTGIRTMFC